jgi:hypothetical protein
MKKKLVLKKNTIKTPNQIKTNINAGMPPPGAWTKDPMACG